jgi:hypothetical protein
MHKASTDKSATVTEVSTKKQDGGPMFHRRNVIIGLGLSCLAPSFAEAEISLDDTAALANEIRSWISDPAHADYFKLPADRGTNRGSGKLAPSDERVKWAAQYLASVPTNLTPIDTAKYMIKTIPSQYIMEWPPDTPMAKLPANPLIIAFFSATKTDPVQGDETAWCAAFACWTLRHCGEPYPNSAGSRSFRDFAKLPATNSPETGDLVVFKSQSRPDNGHVAFFEKVWCVGGNQGNRLSRKPFSVATGDLRVVSYRTGEGLRGPK